MSNKFSDNQIEHILNSTKVDKGSSKHFDSTLYMINYLLEDPSNEKTVVGYINKLLKSSPIDEEVCIYLGKVITAVSAEALFDNITYWMQRLMDRNKIEINSRRYTVISTLIELGKDYQHFNKLMLSLLFELLDECLSVDLESFYIQNSLMCLATCMEAYPTNCLSKRKDIETYLIQFLFSKVATVKSVRNAALCFQKLQMMGSPGVDMINYRSNWKNAFERLCVTLDVLYDVFFDDVEEFHKYEKLSSSDSYPIPDFPKVISSTEMVYTLEHRLQYTCLFLRGMLENEFICAKCFRPQFILNVIGRVLSLHSCVIKSPSDTTFHFSMVLLKNQIAILYLLRSLMAVLKLNLLQFSATISKLLIDCLTRTHNCNCFKCMGAYKEALYKVLEYWVQVLKNSFSCNMHDKLINLIIKDISFTTTNVSLTIPNTKDNTSKKAKSKCIESKIISSSTKYSHSGNHLRNVSRVEEKICYQSLCCLSALLNNVHITLKDATYATLYDILIRGILSRHNGKKILPYDTDRVNLKLFEVLIAILEYSKPPPSFSLIINLVGDGGKRSATALACSKYLNLLEKICQPVCPSWDFNPTNVSTLTTSKTSEIGEIIPNGGMDKEIEEQLLEENQHLEIVDINGDENAAGENASTEKSGFDSDMGMEEQTNSVNENQTATTENEIEEDLLNSSFQTDESIINSKDISTVSDCSVNENDADEPAHKKPKTSPVPDINAMLTSFVDEIQTLPLESPQV